MLNWKDVGFSKVNQKTEKGDRWRSINSKIEVKKSKLTLENLFWGRFTLIDLFISSYSFVND
jgi:hypothetical protein